MRVAILLLGGLLLATPARATELRVGAETNASTLIRRPCDGGPCCNTCHAGQPAPREKGDLVLYEGKTRTVLPRSGFILKDEAGGPASSSPRE
jgi:hypothetical protein